MFRFHFPIKPLFWGTFIQLTPMFKSHIVPPLPRKQVHIIFLSVTSIEWTPLFSGTSVLVLRLSPEWRIHCIMFVSVTSVVGTPLLWGHLAWS